MQAFHSGQLDGAELTQAVVTDIEKKKSSISKIIIWVQHDFYYNLDAFHMDNLRF